MNGLRFGLLAHVLGVHIDAGLGVVHQIPSGMVGIVVHDKIIARTIPAPIGGERPIECGDLKGKTVREPKAMMVAIKSFHVVAV